MRYLTLLLWAISMGLSARAQQVADLHALLGPAPKLDRASRQEFETAHQLMQAKAYEQLSPEEKSMVDRWEMRESIYDVMDAGCSWYCAGGPKTVRASSALPTQGSNTYTAGNAHDLSLRTAWVEGVEGQGTGEYLEYIFEPESPRITHIKVYNGYAKSEKAWRANSRVKRLDVYVNGAPYARLHLKDSRAGQTFSLPAPLGRRPDGREMVVRFQIASVYAGDKYEDTAITEIFFDGLDVHCLAAGTRIRLSDGSEKPIEQLEHGDSLLYWTGKVAEPVPLRLLGLRAFQHRDCLRLTFSDGRSLTATPGHPFLLTDGRWASADAIRSRSYGYPVERTYRPGDTFTGLDAGGKETAVRLTKIQSVADWSTTYMLVLESQQNGLVLANGLLTAAGHEPPIK